MEKIKLNFWGSYSGEFEINQEKKWKVLKGIFPNCICEMIIKDYDPKHDVKKRAEIGITWSGYGLSPYFSECAGGGFVLCSSSITISDKLMSELKNIKH